MRDKNGAIVANQPEKLNDAGGAYGLDLPKAPAWFSQAPKGSMEDGIKLSLLALDQVKERPEIFAAREKRMCTVEFKL